MHAFGQEAVGIKVYLSSRMHSFIDIKRSKTYKPVNSVQSEKLDSLRIEQTEKAA